MAGSPVDELADVPVGAAFAVIQLLGRHTAFVRVPLYLKCSDLVPASYPPEYKKRVEVCAARYKTAFDALRSINDPDPASSRRNVRDSRRAYQEEVYERATRGQIGGRVRSILERPGKEDGSVLEQKCRDLERQYRAITWRDVHADMEHVFRGDLITRQSIEQKLPPADMLSLILDRQRLWDESVADSLPSLYLRSQIFDEQFALSGNTSDPQTEIDTDPRVLMDVLRGCHLYQGIMTRVELEVERGQTEDVVEALIVLFNTENVFQFIYPDVTLIMDHLVARYGTPMTAEARTKMGHFLQESFFAASTTSINDWGYARDVCAEFVHALHDAHVGPLLWRDCVDYCTNDRWLYPPFLYQLKYVLSRQYPEAGASADLCQLLGMFYQNGSGDLRTFMGQVNIIIGMGTRQYETAQPDGSADADIPSSSDLMVSIFFRPSSCSCLDRSGRRVCPSCDC